MTENKQISKWFKLIVLQSPFKRLIKDQKETVNEIEINDTHSKAHSWLNKIITNKNSTKNSTHSFPSLKDSLFQSSEKRDLEMSSSHEPSSTSVHTREIVPLKQFLRHGMDQSDQRAFKRNCFIRPFEPKYEVEWQKNHWLQLDQSTSKQIERLRQQGFTKMPIRQDSSLKKHIEYEHPNDMDVLLELSFQPPVTNKSETFECHHQPTHFPIRRIHWWKTSYDIGEAYLPAWVDTDLCCDNVIMDPTSVLAALSNYSSSSITNSPQTSVVGLDMYKPLKYSEPSLEL